MKKKIALNISLKLMYLVLFLCLCCEKDSIDKKEVIEAPKEWDLGQIKKSGKLRALTVYSGTSYFLYKGRPMGYEFELLERFSEYLDVDLEIIVVDNIDELFEKLNNGEGDIVAYGLTITANRKEDVSFTDHLYLTKQVLVQKKPDNWRTMPWKNLENALVQDPIGLLGDTISVREMSSYKERIYNLSEELGGMIYINILSGEMSTDEIIERVAKGEIKYTISDDNIASIMATYYPILDVKVPVSFSQRIAWATRHDSQNLLIATNNWLEEIKRQIDFNVIYNTPGPTNADNRNASPNILANPYPSAISADDFISANPMINEVYFWEHLTPPSPSYPGAGSMNFSMQDISMYNLTGGTAAANDPGTTTEPNGIISTGQGFAIKASAAGIAEFNNSMRLLNGNNTLRSASTITNSLNKERIWITLNSINFDLQNTTLLGFSDNATNEIDPGYDSRCLATVMAVYTLLDDGSEQLGIQSRGKFKFGTKVPLGFSSQILGIQEYEISIANLEGFNLSGANVYLWDDENQTMTKINNTPYKFKSKDGIYNERFVLLFTRKAINDNKILESNDKTFEPLYLFPNPTKGVINVSAQDAIIKKVIIYDLQGRMVTSKSFNDTTIQIDISGLSPSIYLMNISTENDTYTRQVIKK